MSGAPLHSVGSHQPDRVVHVRSFSKAYGPDLRLAAIGGRADVVDAVVHRRQLGPAWSSLQDPDVDRLVARAADRYAERRRSLTTALAERGVDLPGRTGFNLWMPVEDETNALIALSARGIGAAPGSPFEAGRAHGHHLRLTVSTVDDDVPGGLARLADDLVAAASVPAGRRVAT